MCEQEDKQEDRYPFQNCNTQINEWKERLQTASAIMTCQHAEGNVKVKEIKRYQVEECLSYLFGEQHSYDLLFGKK